MMDLVHPTTPERPSPRERLLQAADRLFYEEGVSSVGVDRILKESDVARASLYSTYGSKDQLLRAYLQNRSHGWQAVVAEALPTRWGTARDRIVGIFEMLTEWFQAPGYHGCPFINASAEAAPSSAIQDVRDDHRAWVRALFTGLARDAGAHDPEALSAQLVLLYDGSMAGAQLDRSAEPGRAAQAATAVLLQAALV
jgi:AcrR family transcriptional regulator